MKYYRFRTFTTSYYFPELSPDKQYMYGLYSAYGGRLAKTYWDLFKKWAFVRKLTAIKERDLPFPYQTIRDCSGKNVLLAFNMGSPGVEQKISMLGYDNAKQEAFFAKFSQKDAAKRLTQNEIEIYKKLDGTNMTPQLQDYVINDQYVYMRTEYINGKRPQESIINENVIHLCLSLSNYHLTNVMEKEGLRYSLSHGDFCPWNMIECQGVLKLIDWELACDRPLGFDLFTYICQVSALFHPETKLIEAINKNMENIRCYFNACGVKDFIPYLKAFAQEKAFYEKGKNNLQLYHKYAKLYEA